MKAYGNPDRRGRWSLSLSVLTAIFQVKLRQPVLIEAKDDGGGGDNWTTGAISRAKMVWYSRV